MPFSTLKTKIQYNALDPTPACLSRCNNSSSFPGSSSNKIIYGNLHLCFQCSIFSLSGLFTSLQFTLCSNCSTKLHSKSELQMLFHSVPMQKGRNIPMKTNQFCRKLLAEESFLKISLCCLIITAASLLQQHIYFKTMRPIRSSITNREYARQQKKEVLLIPKNAMKNNGWSSYIISKYILL